MTITNHTVRFGRPFTQALHCSTQRLHEYRQYNRCNWQNNLPFFTQQLHHWHLICWYCHFAAFSGSEVNFVKPIVQNLVGANNKSFDQSVGNMQMGTHHICWPKTEFCFISAGGAICSYARWDNAPPALRILDTRPTRPAGEIGSKDVGEWIVKQNEFRLRKRHWTRFWISYQSFWTYVRISNCIPISQYSIL